MIKRETNLLDRESLAVFWSIKSLIASTESIE